MNKLIHIPVKNDSITLKENYECVFLEISNLLIENKHIQTKIKVGEDISYILQSSRTYCFSGPPTKPSIGKFTFGIDNFYEVFEDESLQPNEISLA